MATDCLPARLREARKDMGLSQEDFGALGGATKKTQFRYESAANSPDARYLTELAANGVDVNYILTGIRSIARPGMSAAEIGLFNEAVDAFWGLSDEDRLRALRFMRNLVATQLDRNGETRGLRRPKPRT